MTGETHHPPTERDATGRDATGHDATGRRETGATSRRDRGQTTFDFLVGMSVFLLTVAFVVAFLPNVFEPFTAEGSDDVLAADRTADLLSEQLLADPATPAVLNATCTEAFFDAAGDGDDGLDCAFDTDANDLRGALGVGPTVSVNVTVEENGSIRSIDSTDLRAGRSPSNSESVVVARRVVLLDGDERDLYVRVW